MEVTIAFWDHGPISHLHLEMIPLLTVHAQLKSLETNAKQEHSVHQAQMPLPPVQVDITVVWMN
jgi:hypothetical protein